MDFCIVADGFDDLFEVLPISVDVLSFDYFLFINPTVHHNIKRCNELHFKLTGKTRSDLDSIYFSSMF